MSGTKKANHKLSRVICHCPISNARDGHIHEKNGHILCLHYENEDGSQCPASLKGLV